MSAKNRTKAGGETEKPAGEFYPTPWEVATACVSVLPSEALTGTIVDAGCGNGQFMSALGQLAEFGRMLVGVDVSPDLVASAKEREWLGGKPRFIVGDFLTMKWTEEPPSLVIGNPPFSLAADFLGKASALVGPTGYVAFLLRVGFATAIKRQALLEHLGDFNLHLLSPRPGFTPDGKNDACEYGFFVFGPECEGHVSILRWKS